MFFPDKAKDAIRICRNGIVSLTGRVSMAGKIRRNDLETVAESADLVLPDCRRKGGTVDADQSEIRI